MPAGSYGQTREDMLAELKANPKVQALVIGGGINGISAFRELALQGVDVLLVERGDFVPARSAALVAHGPWRPALSREWRVRAGARVAARAGRAAAQRAALVSPLPTTVPIHTASAAC